MIAITIRDDDVTFPVRQIAYQHIVHALQRPLVDLLERLDAIPLRFADSVADGEWDFTSPPSPD